MLRQAESRAHITHCGALPTPRTIQQLPGPVPRDHAAGWTQDRLYVRRIHTPRQEEIMAKSCQCLWVYWILKSSVLPTFHVKLHLRVKYFKSAAALGRRWRSAGSVRAPLWWLSGQQRLKTPTNPSWSLVSGCSDPVKADAPWLTHSDDALPRRPLTFLGAPHSPQAPSPAGRAGFRSLLWGFPP